MSDDIHILKTVKSVSGGLSDDEIVITFSDNSYIKMFHRQDCCENVYLEDDEDGGLKTLVGSVLMKVEESTSNEAPLDVMKQRSESEGYIESETWTFYKLFTSRGIITLRWLGESNGYYSENVDIVYCDYKGREIND